MTRSKSLRWTLFAVFSLALVIVVGSLVVPSAVGGELSFDDIGAQTKRFIEYEASIKLTTQQDAIKREALEAIPAPCCSDNTAYTCCCPCNMARAIWGLSAYLITEKEADATAVREGVQAWLKAAAPKGHSGDVCYTGGCGRGLSENGCGGMNRTRLRL